MSNATIRIDPAFIIGALNRRIFGTFVEHMGRCVYTGIYEPEHATADEFGFRGDVADLVRELGPTLVRYPGGNFVSNYRWEDGVGAKADRPTVLDLAWRSIETNQVGTDDFLAWCARMEIEPMMAVNLGTRGLAAAIELVQYVNSPTGTAVADRRAANGFEKPHDVRLWCLGNEMDGPWQIGHQTATEYARLAEETAKAMHRIDPGLELVACGSSNRAMPTFGEWERVVLERCFEHVDHISAHAYYEPHDGDLQSFLASGEDMQRFISSVVATADHVAALQRSEKRITVSFDEWNVWYQQRFNGENSIEVQHAPRLIEDVYTVLDAVVVGDLLITLINNTDRVAVACQAQLANIIAPIMTEPDGPAWRQTIFHPFALAARHASGTVLRPAVSTPSVDTAALGRVPALTTAVTVDLATGRGTVLLANRHLTDELEVVVDLSALGVIELLEHVYLADDDPHASNTAADPERVVPQPGSARISGGLLEFTAPAVSWHCIRFTIPAT
ncbi:alpha-N-arabinofuranosidase [Nakamurella sp. A5-74]|uniref:non-reducing end alpha-L-arabinofuranosidase n=1 Tax=Nakamurella sp. A5-74 TaxID=3158264 RepID=A0AAU8DQV6_9ACTN